MLIDENVIPSNVLASKKALDSINFGGLYAGYDSNEVFLPTEGSHLKVFDQNEVSSAVRIAYKNCKKHLGNCDCKKKIGVISHGTHALDFLCCLDDTIDLTRWDTKHKIMIVFESPASNLNCSGVCEDADPSFEDLLSRTWWRLDDIENKKIEAYQNFGFFEKQKKYGEFILSFILNFRILNVYTTNLCRFEFFEGDYGKGAEERFCNWHEIPDECKNECYKTIFCEELRQFEPDIILTTSNPYDFLRAIPQTKDKLHKILHPANPSISGNYRQCCNICDITKALYKAGIIDADRAKKYFETYLEKQE